MDNENSIILTVAIGSLMMFFLVMIIITIVVLYGKKMDQKNNAMEIAAKNQELQLLKSVLETQEAERAHLAANLHDEIGPLLASHKLNLNLLIYDLKDGILTADKIKTEQVFIDRIIDDIRRVSYDLTPHFLLKFGLAKALQSFLAKINAPKIEMDIDFGSLVLSKTLQINTYRIVLEVLNNIIKHDTPSALKFSGRIQKGAMVVEVIHNGRGLSNDEFIDLAKNSTGLGLNSIQSRVSVLGAKLVFNTTNGKAGFELHIPIANEEEKN